jgi:hypothetical protein
MSASLLLTVLVAIGAPATPPAAPPAAASPEAPAPDLRPDWRPDWRQDWRPAWLDFAFEVAAAIPRQPHANDRAKAEEIASLGYLEIGERQRAGLQALRIEGWRKGTALAEIAGRFAAAGEVETARKFLEVAERVADTQVEWRRDRVRVAVAKALVRLGEAERAEELAKGAVPEEAGKLTVAKAVAADSYAESLAGLDGLAAAGRFELVRLALDGYVELLEAQWSDPARRAELDARIRKSFEKLPVSIPVETLARMADTSVKRGDQPRARAELGEARDRVAAANWLPDIRCAIDARLAAVRFRAGETAEAKADAEAAGRIFDEGRDRIIDIDRAAALRALGSAWAAMGEGTKALETYRRALDEGAVNPNSRPRAVDLSATCVSMAVAGVEPDAAFRERAEAIRQALGDPW